MSRYTQEPLIGLELTFLPPNRRFRWKEFLKEEDAKAAVDRLNEAFRTNEIIKKFVVTEGLSVEQPFIAKADPFRVKWSEIKQPHDAWCVEVNSIPLSPQIIVPPLNDAIKALYSCAAAQGLVPHWESRARDGSILDYPTGGGHIHASFGGLWDDGPQLFPRLFLLERCLCLDYVNNPWIRWLFAQWSDDINSHVAVNRKLIVEVLKTARKEKLPPQDMTSWAHARALDCSSIKQRLGATGKTVYPTWEFRFFDMPRTPEELGLQVRFLCSWITHRVDQITDNWEEGVDKAEKDKRWKALNRVQTLQLTPYRWDRLVKDPSYAKDQVSSFMVDDLKMFPEHVEAIMAAFWERSYLRRRRFGQFV